MQGWSGAGGGLWRRAALAAVALAVMVASMPAGATTLRGGPSSGMVNSPSADVGPAREFALGLRVVPGAAEGSNYTFIRYGLTPDLTVGITSTDLGTRDFGPLVTYRVMRERDLVPAVAVGIEGTGAYAVASHNLGLGPLRGHVGIQTNNRAAPNAPAGMFAGMSALINPVSVRAPGEFPWPIVSLGADYDGRYLNAGASLQFGTQVRLELGMSDRGGLQFVGGVVISATL